MVCAVLACAALDAQAAGRAVGRAFMHGPAVTPARVHPGFHPGFVRPGHFGSRVVVGAAFAGVGVGVGLWPGYYYPPAYYAPPPPVIQYWYYCPPAGAYYPYVQNCPAPWQLVAPTPSPYTY